MTWKGVEDMTLRVKVTNEDQTRTLRVTPHDVPGWAATFEIACNTKRAESHDLAPGESTEMYVHSGRLLVCEEI